LAAARFVSLHRTRLASGFDRILIMEQGPLVEQGHLAKLQRPRSALAPLMAAERAVLALPTGH
jgi:ABC-type bacteriocin/lantibiotic exporter with double-glycine peptidase domain